MTLRISTPNRFKPNNLRLGMRRAVFHAQIAWRAMKNRAVRRRLVVVLCTRRTGSNLLLSCLNSVWGIAALGEPLNSSLPHGIRTGRVSARSALRHLRRTLASSFFPIGAVKLFFDQLEQYRISLADLTREFPGVKFLVLYRKDFVAQHVSFVVARTSRIWVLRGGEPKPPPIRRIQVQPDRMREDCAKARAFYDQAARSEELRGVSEWLSYEELCEDAQKVFDEKIFPFLNVPRTPVTTDTLKILDRSLDQVVENWDQIAPLQDKPEWRLDYEAVCANGSGARQA